MPISWNEIRSLNGDRIMTENIKSKKSLLEQVFDEMFQIISKHKEFETATIDTLKDMASGDGLKKSPQIIKVIKSSEKEVS